MQTKRTDRRQDRNTEKWYWTEPCSGPQQRTDFRSERTADGDRLYNILNIYIHRTRKNQGEATVDLSSFRGHEISISF